tara:strand:+ start:1134 stop:1457 length:324 start_codon:yes stop_codon:yes gene_type:complete
MTEQSNIYGEGSFTGGEQVSLPTPEKIEEKKKTYPLRIHFTGGSVDIMSPLPKEKFLLDLIAEIQAKQNDPQWIGWFGFKVLPKSAKDKKNKTVSVMVRQIVGVEEL